MSCCVTALLALVARLAILFWYLADPQRFALAFRDWVLPGISIPAWIWAVLGGIFLPWTTLAYLIVFPGGITGYDWIVLAVAFLVDLVGHGGSYRHRRRVLVYRRR